MTFQTNDENPVIDTSVLKDKWSQESINHFNKFMTSVRDLLTKSEEIKSSVKNGFRHLKLLNIKLSKTQKGDMACVFINMETQAVFEFYRISGEIEIVDYESAFQYKETVRKRLDAASQMENDEKEEYLNRYCHVDVYLLNSVCVELENRSKEEFILPKGICINPGESKTFCNKLIDLTNDIECEGELNFVNCEIMYHKKYEGQIIFGSCAKLNFNRCIFRCYGCNKEMPMIKIRESSNTLAEISFQDSKFYDCSNLILGNYDCIISELNMERCEFFDCFNLILEARVIGGCKIKKCKFITRRIADFYLENDEYKIENIIGIDEGDLYLENLEVRFDKEIIKSMKENGDRIESCFLLDNEEYFFVVEKCYFEDAGCCLSGVSKADQCKFINCETAIYSCTDATRIINCTFDNCKERILALSGDNNFVVDCIFKNITFKEDDGWLLDHSLISCRKGSHCIRNCKFTNIVKNGTRSRDFLIGFSGYDSFNGKKVLQLQDKVLFSMRMTILLMLTRMP